MLSTLDLSSITNRLIEVVEGAVGKSEFWDTTDRFHIEVSVQCPSRCAKAATAN